MIALTKKQPKKKSKQKKQPNKTKMTDNYLDTFTTEEELNNEIRTLEDKIKQLKRKKRTIKIIELCKISKKQLKRTSDFNVDLKYEVTHNDNDEYAKTIKSSFDISYNYTMVDFVSPTEIKKTIYMIRYNINYDLYRTYHNRNEPEITCGSQLTVCDENGGKVYFDYNEENDQQDENIITYDDEDGKWGHVLESMFRYGSNICLWEEKGKGEFIELFK